MFRSGATFVFLFILFAAHYWMYEVSVGMRVSKTPLPDGWNLSCAYYTPFRITKVVRPVQSGCDLFGRI